MIIAGIDEAGRGPVIGPMVMAGVSLEEKDLPKLKELGVKDSKLLIKAKREELFKKILAIVKDFKIITVGPDEIDLALQDPKNNLNRLEATTTTKLLNHLKPKKAFIDLPDKNAERYKNQILEAIEDEDIELVAEHKADLNYVIVGAASILAKVTRDRYIDMLKERFGEDFGSGYMTDPKTKNFLEKHWDNHDIYFFRKSWASWQNLRDGKEQKRLFDY